MLGIFGRDVREAAYWRGEYKAEVDKNKAVRQELERRLKDAINRRDLAQWERAEECDARDKLQTELLDTQAELKPPKTKSYVEYIEYILDAHAERIENLERRMNNE
jgi:hypothetical protein